jgi:3-isopropylmalate/(R)-2-methylmalate dehydratase large subunit
MIFKMTHPKTLFQKLWDLHYVGNRKDGKEIIYIDRHVIHELHVPHAFARLKKSNRAILRKDLTVIVQDHTVPTILGVELISDHIRITRLFAEKYNIKLIDVNSEDHGIVHIVSSEQGYALPGFTLACPDSHASTVGALGCLAFACGTSELEHVLATQTIVLDKPKQMKVNFVGKLNKGVTAKDLALYLISKHGVAAGAGYVVEFCGEIIDSMKVEERMTLCNMSIEWGCKSSLIAPDDKVFNWLKDKLEIFNEDEKLTLASWWETLKSDENAIYDHEIEINCSNISPQITWGTDPSQTINIDEIVPHNSDRNSMRYSKNLKSLEYMGIQEGKSLLNLKVDCVFIGSCSNSRLNDLRDAAKIIQGKTISKHVKAIVVPGSTKIKQQAEEEGIDQIFLRAGFEWRNSGCSMCAGANGDVGNFGERIISTSNRNFENRQGRGVKTHLTSPIAAAAIALRGYICDVREFI